jgi:hypothetical protein
MKLVHVVLFAGLFTGRSLVEPTPITVETARNPDQVTAAVADAASRAGWKAQLATEHAIRATYRLNQYSATVLLNIAQGGVSLRYENSENLQYKQTASGAEIHKLYFEWERSLMSAIRAELTKLCPDLSNLQNAAYIGLGHQVMELKLPAKGMPARELSVKSSSGVDTGYFVREYSAYLAGETQACGPVSFVYYKDKLTSVTSTRMEGAALVAYTDLLNYLVKNGSISFSDGEMERMSLKVDTVMVLDLPRREELLRFVEWQAQRFDRKETTQKEYEFLLAQKEAEIRERQGSIDQKEGEIRLLRVQSQLQAASLDTQQQQLQSQRALALSQALQNIYRSTVYVPPVRLSTTCTSSAFAGRVTTTCN